MRASRGFHVIAMNLLALAAASAAEEFGDISGQFVVEGPVPPQAFLVKGQPGMPNIPDESIVVDKKTRGLANVFVYLRKAPVEEIPSFERQPAKEPEVVVTVKNSRYEPHAVFVRTDQKLRFCSFDPVLHNVHTYTLGNPQQNFHLKAGDKVGVTIEVKAAETLPMPVKDDIHPWMRSSVLVLDHPYAAVTDKNGKFTIRGLPAGEHSFRVWHENPGYIDRAWKIQVVGGKTTELPTVQVPVETVKEKKAGVTLPRPLI